MPMITPKVSKTERAEVRAHIVGELVEAKAAVDEAIRDVAAVRPYASTKISEFKESEYRERRAAAKAIASLEDATTRAYFAVKGAERTAQTWRSEAGLKRFAAVVQKEAQALVHVGFGESATLGQAQSAATSLSTLTPVEGKRSRYRPDAAALGELKQELTKSARAIDLLLQRVG